MRRKKALLDTIKSWPDLSEAKVEARYKEMDKDLVGEPPPATKNIDFDNWMDKQRTRLKKKLTDAGVTFKPEDVDKWLFFGITVDPSGVNANIKRHRDYQLRVLAIFEEVAEAVTDKKGLGTQPISLFETDPQKPEGTGTTPVSVLHLDNFAYHTPEETGPLDTKGYADAALQKSGYHPPTYPRTIRTTSKALRCPSPFRRPKVGIHQPHQRGADRPAQVGRQRKVLCRAGKSGLRTHLRRLSRRAQRHDCSANI